MALEDAIAAEITQLEAQKIAIDARLAALRQVAQILHQPPVAAVRQVRTRESPSPNGPCAKAGADGQCNHVGRHVYAAVTNNDSRRPT